MLRVAFNGGMMGAMVVQEVGGMLNMMHSGDIWFINGVVPGCRIGHRNDAAGPGRRERPDALQEPAMRCCLDHAEHLRQNGFNVTDQATHDPARMSSESGIPEEFQGCHLAFVDGYAAGGYVPASTVRKLVTERSHIKGVSLPGMPSGSPGMPGPKEGPLEI